MDENANPHRPLWRGFGYASAVLVLVMIGVTLLQFFLQFALAPEYSNTSEFWIDGILIGIRSGATIGILPAVAVGFLAWSKAAPIKTQLQQKNGLVTQEKNWSIRDDVSSEKQNAQGTTAESARRRRSFIGFALILFVPTILCIGFMFIWVWLVQ